MFKSRTLISLMVVPLLALLIACGGGDDDDSSSGGSSSGGGASGGGDDRAVATQTGGGGNTSNSSDDIDLDNCPELLAFAKSAGMGDAFSGGDFEDLNADNFRKLADKAPREIKAEMTLIAAAMGDFFEALEDLDVNLSDPSSFARLSASDLQKLEEVTSKLDTPKLQEASDKVTAYFEDKCD